MIYLAFIFLAIAAIVAVSSNPDMLSPAKLLLVTFAMFHAGALYTELPVLAGGMIFLVLAVCFVVTFAEGQMVQGLPPMRKRWRLPDPRQAPDFATAIWLFSAPSLIAQLFMIQQFGGLSGYIDSLGTRVVDWAGFGWARTLINLMTPLNLIYFALGLQTRRDRRWWTIYGLHFLILLMLGVLSGSRSSLLTVFAIQLMLFHYLRTPVKGRIAAVLAGTLILSAFTLGVLRNGVSIGDEGIEFGTFEQQSTASLGSFNAGVQALKVITEAPFMPLAHGSTFVSVLTNAVPRAVWPDKPDPGGVFFTKHYTGDAWYGFSNLAPTFLGEFLINFGWAWGVAGFALVYPLILLAVVRFYRSQRIALQQVLTPAMAIDVVLFLTITWSMVGLMVGETTNVVVNLVFSQVIPILFVRFYVRRVSSHRASRWRAAAPATAPRAASA